MTTQWTHRRYGYRYPGFLFSEDGTVAKEGGLEYREQPFSITGRRRFRIWLALTLLTIFPGIPLLVLWGLHLQLLWIIAAAFGLSFWLYQHIHDCPQCGSKSRVLYVRRMGAPVLFLCPHCHTFFEHSEIDGGWPWRR